MLHSFQLNAKSAVHDESRFAHHEQKHKIQPRKWKSVEATKATSFPGVKSYTKENTLTSDTNFSKGKQNIEKVKSLPRIYSMTSNPTHDEDGDVWRYIKHFFKYDDT